MCLDKPRAGRHVPKAAIVGAEVPRFCTVFADWEPRIAEMTEHNMRKPGEYAAEIPNPREKGRVFDDYCN